MDWTHLEETTHQHDQISSDLEPTGEKKTGKTQEQLEKVCGGRTKRNRIILERTLNNILSPKLDFCELSMLPEEKKGLSQVISLSPTIIYSI
jgi:hypothetical protein